MGNEEKELVEFFRSLTKEPNSFGGASTVVAFRYLEQAASTIERLSAIEQWSLCKDGVPAAITLMVARFDHELGEWIVGVTESYMIGKEPKSIPAWTHWRYLPNMPEAPDGH